MHDGIVRVEVEVEDTEKEREREKKGTWVGVSGWVWLKKWIEDPWPVANV